MNTRSVNDDASLHAQWAWLFAFVRPKASAMAAVLVLSLFASGLVLLQPVLVKRLIDDGLLARNSGLLWGTVGMMVGVGLVSTLLSGVNRYLHTRLSASVLFALRQDVFGHLQKLSPSVRTRWRTGDVLSRLDGDVTEIQRFAVDSLFALFSNAVGLLGALAWLMWLSVPLTFLVLLFLPLQWWWLYHWRPRVAERARDLRARGSDVSSFFVEVLPAMKFVQASGQEAREAHRLEVFHGRYLSSLLRLQVVEFATQAIPGQLTAWARALAFLVGGLWVIDGQWALGSLVAFSAYLGMASGPVGSLLGWYVGLQKVKVSLERVQALRQEPVTVLDPERPCELPQPSQGQFSLQGVRFAHQMGEVDVLSGVTMVIPGGKKTLITGASGAGKSTLIDLLLRHNDPDEGGISLDGVDLRCLRLRDLRQAVAVVSQDIVLFRASLRENLTYASADATEAQIAEVVERAGLTDWVRHLPEGLETHVGERGQTVSGGQRQRIAIARALLQNPVVLILDEATNALDEPLEAEVLAQIDQAFGDRTRIVVSHRRSTWAQADVHLRLVRGRLEPVSASEEPFSD